MPPSGDQPRTLLLVEDCSSSSSSPAPLDDLTYISRTPLRSEEKAIRLPSGDHAGFISSAGSNVKRELVCFARSRIQISRLRVARSARPTAKRFPSRESAGLE